MSIAQMPVFKDFIISRFDDMEKFKQFTLNAIINEKESISNRFDKDLKKLPKEQIQEYSEYIAEDYFMVENYFTQISLRSFLVILFAYIEDGMNLLCNVMYSDKVRNQKEKGLASLNVKYKDMKCDGVTRAKLYLTKVIGCDLHIKQEPWSEIVTLRKLRNVIVHKDGKANDKLKNDGKFKQHLSDGDFELNNHGKIVISKKYLNYILPQVKKFFSEIELN